MNDSSCDGSFELAADDQERVLARTELLTAFDKVRDAPGTGAAAAAATAAAVQQPQALSPVPSDQWHVCLCCSVALWREALRKMRRQPWLPLPS